MLQLRCLVVITQADTATSQSHAPTCGRGSRQAEDSICGRQTASIAKNAAYTFEQGSLEKQPVLLCRINLTIHTPINRRT